MNERVMQFRIGMFVIVAGLVLTMLIVWFGESPTLFRDHSYFIVRFDEAPGVAEGIGVRKSGIHVGEVTAIAFDDRPNQPDGVLVTISLDNKFKFKAGTVPRLGRSLIGDVSIDLMPGPGPGLMKTSKTPKDAPVVEGMLTPDPSKALEAATKAFEKVGGTLKSIDDAANGIARVSDQVKGIDDFISTWTVTGKSVESAASDMKRLIQANEKDFGPAVADFRQIVDKFNKTLDPAALESLRTGLKQFSEASTHLNSGLASAAPLFRDLGAPVNSTPQTDFGSVVRRANLITSDLNLLTRTLRGPTGKLNTDGSLQKLLTSAELYDNMNKMSASGMSAFENIKPILQDFRTFAAKIARDPSSIAKGALAR